MLNGKDGEFLSVDWLRNRKKSTLEAFLEWENAQDTRNEFYRGDVLPKADPRRSHGTVTSNLVRHLGNAQGGSPCRVFYEGMKVQIAGEAILYQRL